MQGKSHRVDPQHTGKLLPNAVKMELIYFSVCEVTETSATSVSSYLYSNKSNKLLFFSPQICFDFFFPS